MRFQVLGCTVALALQCVPLACAQQAKTAQKPPESPSSANFASLTFSFAVRAGEAPLRFQLELDAKGYVTGIAVFDAGKSTPRQTLASCGGTDETVDDLIHDTDDPLLKHADLNFDGYEDIELMYMYVPHLGKRLDCMYMWDSKAERFVYSKMLTEIGVNLQAHPEDHTLTTHEDWMFGPWQDSTYRWIEGKPVLVEQVSLLGSWGQTDNPCGFTYTCSRRIVGKIVDTLTRKICKPEEMDDLPDCPREAPVRRPQGAGSNP